MKTSAIRTPPVIVPINGGYLQKEYGLTQAETKNAMKKMSGLHAKRKVAGKVVRVKGRLDESFFD